MSDLRYLDMREWSNHRHFFQIIDNLSVLIHWLLLPNFNIYIILLNTFNQISIV